MHRPSTSFFGRLAICGLLALSGAVTACSDDGGDDDANADAIETTTTTERVVADADSDWCEASRAVSNAIPSKALEAVEAAAAAAPESLRPAYDVMIELEEFKRDNPSDAVGLAERQESVEKAYVEIATVLSQRCGISLGF